MSPSNTAAVLLHSLGMLQDGEPTFIDAADLLVYPQAGVVFIDGHPHSLDQVQDLYVALVDACATINSQSPAHQTWETSAGFLEVTGGGFNVTINGIPHTPETVDVYAQALRAALEICPQIHDL